MKRSLIHSIYLLGLGLAMTMTSGCLKDDDFDNGKIQSVHATGSVPKIVEIKLTAGSTSNVKAYSFDNSPNDTVLSVVPVNLATNEAAAQDLHVTLVPNNALVDAYNANNGTDYIPTTNYTLINNGVVTIPQGQRTAFLQIGIKPSDFLGSTYAAGFTLSKVDESGYNLSGNMSNGIIIINIKNEYEGLYRASGAREHPSAGHLPFDYDVYMLTLNKFAITGNAGFDNKVNLILTVNPDDNSVTVQSTDLDLLPSPGKENKYDPATKTFTLNYYYNTAAPRVITETLVRK